MIIRLLISTLLGLNEWISCADASGFDSVRVVGGKYLSVGQAGVERLGAGLMTASSTAAQWLHTWLPACLHQMHRWWSCSPRCCCCRVYYPVATISHVCTGRHMFSKRCNHIELCQPMSFRFLCFTSTERMDRSRFYSLWMLSGRSEVVFVFPGRSRGGK